MKWLTAAPALLAACTYHPRALDVLEGPVAVIGDGSGDYRVAASAPVLLDGSASHHLGGQVLTFAWDIEEGCAGAPIEPAQLLEPVVHFQSAADGGGCDVSLTVTDEDGLSDTATAVVEVHDVGAYVGTTNCVDNIPGLAGRGSQGTPWCSPIDGARAAADYHLADMWISSEPFEIDTALVVPPGVALHGGRDPSSWGQTATLTNLGLRGDARVDLRGPLLSSVAVYRLEDCSGSCDLVTVRGVPFAEIDGCTLGVDRAQANETRTVGDDHPSSVARTLHVISGEASVSIFVHDSIVFVPYIVGQSYGIFLDGRGGELTGELVSSSVQGDTDAWVTAGVRTLATEGLTLTDMTVGMSSIYDSTYYAFGLLDGIAGVSAGLDPDVFDVRCAPGELTCSASHGLLVNGYLGVTLVSQTHAVGVGLLGTSESLIDPELNVMLDVHGADPVVGLWTYDTNTVGVSDVNTIAESNLDGGAGTGLVAGALDGGVELGTEGEPIEISGGSTALSLERVGAVAQVFYERTTPIVAAGIALLETTNGSVRNSDFSWSSVSNSQPLAGVGLWTVNTSATEVTNCNWYQDPAWPARATLLAAAMVDGFPEEVVGSTSLVLAGAYLEANLEATDTSSTAACVIWSHSHGSDMRSNEIACAPSVTRDLFHGVLLLGTVSSTLSWNRVSRLTGAPMSSVGTVVGIRDGVTGRYGGSSVLELRGNRVFVGSTVKFDSAIGIWLDHVIQPSVPQTKVINNVVHGIGTLNESIALRLRDAAAEVFNNTLLGGDCAVTDKGGDCINPTVTAGVEVEGASRTGPEVLLANNLIDGGQGQHSRGVIDKSMTGTDQLSLSLFAANALVDYTGVPNACTVYGVGPTAGTICADSLTYVSLLAQQAGVPGSFGGGVVVAETGLCADGVHLNPGGPVGIITNLRNSGDDGYAARDDIDARDRSDGSVDIGADEVDDTPCGGY